MAAIDTQATGLKPDRVLPVALHAQILWLIRSRIVSGEWPPHRRLKAKPQLTDDLGVSRGILKKALATLVSEGLLVRTRGRGTFVTSSTIEPFIAQKLSSLSEGFASHGVRCRRRSAWPRSSTRPPPSLRSLNPPFAGYSVWSG